MLSVKIVLIHETQSALWKPELQSIRTSAVSTPDLQVSGFDCRRSRERLDSGIPDIFQSGQYLWRLRKVNLCIRVCVCCVCVCVCANRHCTVVLTLISGLFHDCSPVTSAVKPRVSSGRRVTADASARGVTQQEKSLSDGNVSVIGQRLVYSNRSLDPDEEKPSDMTSSSSSSSSPQIRATGRQPLRALRPAKGSQQRRVRAVV
ncbi:uncharacterized protein LOC122144589 [Cyprinus carpio]|uniref:Uncharacterized protein LOC122144589 n=1 Tax=Cyprinus carpio TaxID=7962 RepID=A0A9Q9Y0U0_CYPCA|nr:uncharacterized protein LOC122144589 [Cyprinus carpio]